MFDTPILESGQDIDASRYNLVWGASDLIIPMYQRTNPDIVVSFYIPWSRYLITLNNFFKTPFLRIRF